MKLHHLVIDDFLDDFSYWREWADGLDYKDVVNPVDGESYPGIYAAVPTWGVKSRIERILGRPINLHTLFLRLSVKGSETPQQIHSDLSMGSHAIIIYLRDQAGAGTAFCRHKTGLDKHPETERELATLVKDGSNAGEWDDYLLCEMKANRALIYDAHLLHRAIPVGGFGDSAKNGRLVMVGFFS